MLQNRLAKAASSLFAPHLLSAAAVAAAAAHTVGKTVGKIVGKIVKNPVGNPVGKTVGNPVGKTVGKTVGNMVGSTRLCFARVANKRHFAPAPFSQAGGAASAKQENTRAGTHTTTMTKGATTVGRKTTAQTRQVPDDADAAQTTKIATDNAVHNAAHNAAHNATQTVTQTVAVTQTATHTVVTLTVTKHGKTENRESLIQKQKNPACGIKSSSTGTRTSPSTCLARLQSGP